MLLTVRRVPPLLPSIALAWGGARAAQPDQPSP